MLSECLIKINQFYGFSCSGLLQIFIATSCILSIFLIATLIHSYRQKKKRTDKKTGLSDHSTISKLSIHESHIFEGRFRSVFETATDAIFLLEEMTVVDCNKKAEEMLGTGREGIVGKEPLFFSSEIQHNGKLSKTKKIEFLDKISKDGHYTFEWEGKRTNGELFLTEISISSFQYSDKPYYTVFVHDITQLKKEQNELEKYRTELEKVVQQQTIQLTEKIKELKVAHEEMETANEELISSNEELIVINEELERANQLLKEEIEEHKKTQEEKATVEEKLKQFLFQSSNGIILINNQGIIEEWNESMTRVTGITKKEAIGHTMWDITADMITPEIDKEIIREKFKNQTYGFFKSFEEGNIEPLTFETLIKHKFSGLRYINTSLFPIVTQSGNYAGCIIIDITRKKETETELEKYREELENLLAYQSEHLVQLSERFNEVFINSQEAITFIDILDEGKTLKVFDMNPAAQKLFNIMPEIMNHGVFAQDLIPQSKLEQFEQKLLPIILSGKSVAFTSEEDTGNGYWNSSIFPIQDDKGKVIRLASFSRNVTSEFEKDRLSAILNSAIDSWPFEFWARDKERRLILQNKVSREKYGDLIGKIDNDMQMPDVKWHSLDHILKRVMNFENFGMEYKYNDGIQDKYVICNVSPIISNNKPIGYTAMLHDITERKKMELALRESEKRFRLIAQLSKQLVYDYDLITNKIQWDGAIEEITGYRPEEYESVGFDQWADMIHHEDKESALLQFEDSIRCGKPYRAQYRYQKRNKDYIWIEEDGHVISGPYNKAFRVLGVMRDISERKQSEEQLLIKNFALESSLSAIGLSDLNGKLMYANDAYIKLWGFDSKLEAIDQNLSSSDLFKDKVSEIMTLVQKNGFYSGEERAYKKDMTPIDIQIFINIVHSPDGKSVCMMASFIDITERKKAEREIIQLAHLHQVILDTVSLGLVFVIDRKIQWANRNFSSMLGYNQPEIINMQASEMYKYDNESERINTEGYPAIARGEIYTTQIELKRKDGHTFWCELVGKAINYKDLSKGSVWFFQDIDKRRNAELALQKSEALLKATMEAMNDGILVVLSDNKITLANSSFKQIFSVPEEFLLVKDDEPLLNHAKNQVSNPEEFYQKVLEIYQSNNITEDILQLTDGRIFERHSFPLTEDSPVKGRVWLFRDITEKRKSEETLKKSQKLLTDSQRIARIGCWEVDLVESKVYWNEETYNIFGFKYMEIQPTMEMLREFVHPDDRVYFNSVDEEMMKTNIFKDHECRIISKDGSTHTILVVGAFAFDGNGKPCRTFGIVQDITERKVSEQKLRESEERYSLVTNLSGYIVYDYSLINQKVIWAGPVNDILGYTKDELEGMSIKALRELNHPDDSYSENFEMYNKNNVSKKRQYRFLTRNRGYVWFETQAFLFNNAENIPARWLGIMKDISEQKKAGDLLIESEKKFRSIFNSSKDGIVLLDMDLNILDINKAILNETEYLQIEIMNKKASDFIVLEQGEESLKWFSDLKNKKVIENFETNLLTSKNEHLPVEISATSLVIDENEVILLLIRDISERKRLEKELLNVVIETEEKERLNFSQELHDGLGPLLSAAKMYVEWLEKPDANIEKNDIIPDIKDLLSEAGDTVREISFKLSPHILQNYGLIEALKAYTKKVMESSKIDIELSINDFKSIGEMADTIIYRVLCECVNNTIKHSKAQKITIAFTSNESFSIIDYADNGVGFNIETTMASRKGVGLMNMQSRLKSINGSLNIQSNEGNGTNISIKIKK